MASIRFAVEGTSRARHNRLLVFARLLDATPFALTAASTILGTPVRHLNQPRALTRDGLPRFDLFGFELPPTAPVAVGDVIVLEGVDVQETEPDDGNA